MVSTAITQAIIAGVGTVILALSAIIVAIWRHVENLHDSEDSKKIDDLQNYRWGKVSSEIQSLYVDVGDYLEDNPHDDDSDLEFEAHLTNIIRDGVDLDDIEDLISNARGLDEPSQLYKRHEAAYEECYRSFIKSAGSLFVLDASIVIGLVLNASPLQGLYLLLNGLIGFVAIAWGWEAISEWSNARDIKKKFDAMWEDYRYDY